MPPSGTANAVMFHTLGGLVQGVILGIALVACAWLLVNRLLRLNASTRFAVWFSLLIVVAVITVLPAARTDDPQPVSRRTAVARRASAVPVALPVAETKAFNDSPPLRTAPRSGGFQLTVPVDRELPSAAAALYCLVVTCLGLRLLLSYFHLRRLKRHCTRAPAELQERFEQWLRLSGCRRSVSLMVSGKARGPLAAGFIRPAVIIPESLLLQITAEEADNIGLHELAHVRRYDDWTTLIQRLLRTLFFFHPAVHWISRQLEFDREVACDDSVLAATDAAKPYARLLTRIAEIAHWRRAPVLASGAVFGKSQIARRIELLLNAARDRRPRISALSFALVMLVVIGIANEFADTPAFLSMVEGRHYQSSRWTIDGRTIQFEMAGDIEFGDDDVSVSSMSPHAFLRIEERTGWSGRKVDVRNGDSGHPEVRYFLHGRERPLDEPARAWLASILPRIIRDSGINAEERARRILETKGAAALVHEIDRITSDSSKRRYLIYAFESGRLQTDDVRRAVRSTSRMSSDHDKASVLIDASVAGLTAELRPYFFDAVDTIGSDHDRRRVVQKVIAEAGTDSETMALAARAVERMSSDHDKAEVLKQMMAEGVLKEFKARQAVLRAVESIQSDHDKARVLKKIFETQEIDAAMIPEIMRVAQGIHSDSDKSHLLEQVQLQSVSAGPAGSAYFAAVRTIQSDNDRARVLTGFLGRGGDMNADLLEEICRSAQGIGSDHDKANVLAALRPPLVPACFEAIRSISSDNDKRRVLERVLMSSASAEIARAVVETASSLSSDHDKAAVLICAAQRYRDDETMAVIRRVAAGVNSDSDYRRVASQLSGRAR